MIFTKREDFILIWPTLKIKLCKSSTNKEKLLPPLVSKLKSRINPKGNLVQAKVKI